MLSYPKKTSFFLISQYRNILKQSKKAQRLTRNAESVAYNSTSRHKIDSAHVRVLEEDPERREAKPWIFLEIVVSVSHTHAATWHVLEQVWKSYLNQLWHFKHFKVWRLKGLPQSKTGSVACTGLQESVFKKHSSQKSPCIKANWGANKT